MSNDLWRTPPEVFNTLNKEFEFVADMAASEENRLCSLYFDEDINSLSIDWADYPCLQSNRTRFVWLNCPYSNPMPWIKKAAESQLNGLGVVMLLNADNSVGWFAEALKTVSEIRFIVADECPNSKRGYKSGRLGFLNGDGEQVNSNNKPQMILVFNPFKIGNCVTSYVKKSEFYKD
jgi:DNA (cytosine-5)-methyltransferase 1